MTGKCARSAVVLRSVNVRVCVCVCGFANDCCLRRSARLEVRERGGFARIWGGFAAGALAEGLSHSSFTVALQADECHSVPKACCTLV